MSKATILCIWTGAIQHVDGLRIKDGKVQLHYEEDRQWYTQKNSAPLNIVIAPHTDYEMPEGSWPWCYDCKSYHRPITLSCKSSGVVDCTARKEFGT